MKVLNLWHSRNTVHYVKTKHCIDKQLMHKNTLIEQKEMHSNLNFKLNIYFSTLTIK